MEKKITKREVEARCVAMGYQASYSGITRRWTVEEFGTKRYKVKPSAPRGVVEQLFKDNGLAMSWGSGFTS